MERVNTSVLNLEDYNVYKDLRDIINSGNNNEVLHDLFESIRDSLKDGIYPFNYILDAKNFLKNRTLIKIDHIKQLRKKLMELDGLNKKISDILKAKDKDNVFRIFDNINHSIKDKTEEVTKDDKIFVTYSLYSGDDYKAIVEIDTNKLIDDIKKVFHKYSKIDMLELDNKSVTKYFEDTLFTAQVFCRFSEYVRYIDFTMYDKDIRALELYEKYKKVLVKIRNIVANRIKYINSNKKKWKQHNISLDTDKELLKKMYDSEKPYMFTREEVFISTYPDAFEKNKSI